MQTRTADVLLKQLQNRHVAPKGERVVDVERAAAPGSDSPEPVLLLTNAALYARAASARDWARLPIHRIRQVEVSSDYSGMLTRYSVVDERGEVCVDVALPMATGSFRERMESLADRQSREPAPRPTVTVSRRPLVTATCWTAAVA